MVLRQQIMQVVPILSNYILVELSIILNSTHVPSRHHGPRPHHVAPIC
jgi:hypothetical protein